MYYYYLQETQNDKDCFSKKCKLCHMKLDITYNILKTYISTEGRLGDPLVLCLGIWLNSDEDVQITQYNKWEKKLNYIKTDQTRSWFQIQKAKITEEINILFLLEREKTHHLQVSRQVCCWEVCEGLLGYLLGL